VSRRLVVEADGGSRGNPGPAGYGALVRDASTGELLAEVAEAIGTATNNVAEYRGLVAGLRAAVDVDPACTVEVRMDSKLVVEQMSGRWQIKHEDMRRLAAQARGVLPPARVRYTWIPRAQNSHADRLANEAMDAAASGRPWVRKTGATASRSSSGPEGAAGQPAQAGPSTAHVPAGPSTARGSVRQPRGAAGEPTALVVVRHGRTAMTELGRFSGRDGADPGLSEAGQDEARRVADLVAGLGRPGAAVAGLAPVGAVVASPLKRTQETAAAVAGRLGLPVTTQEGWVEAGFGDWEGLTYAEILRRDPDLLQRWQGSTTVAPPGGESLDEVVARVRAARAEVVEAHAGRTVVVVTHATPVRVVVHEALDGGPAALWRLRVTPCAVTAVRYWDDGGIELVTANATAHLGGS